MTSQHLLLTWLEGRCLETASSTSYGPFVDLLRGYFTATDDGRGDPPTLAAASARSSTLSGMPAS